jgi:hypothetical protein
MAVTPQFELLAGEALMALRASLGDAHLELDLAFDVDPRALLEAAEAWLGDVQSGKREGWGLEETFGALLGEQIVRGCGWEWTRVDEAVAVVSRDRAYMTFPFSVITRILGAERAPTLVLLYYMIKTAELPPPRSDQPVTLG